MHLTPTGGTVLVVTYYPNGATACHIQVCMTPASYSEIQVSNLTPESSYPDSFLWLLQSLQTNATIVHQILPELHPSKFF
jgi:hypothetical protein